MARIGQLKPRSHHAPRTRRETRENYLSCVRASLARREGILYDFVAILNCNSREKRPREEQREGARETRIRAFERQHREVADRRELHFINVA